MTALQADLLALKGGVALVENAGGNFSRQPQGGGNPDWKLNRFGATIPEGNLALRRQAGADVVAAFGVPAALYVGTDGAGVQRSVETIWRCLSMLGDPSLAGNYPTKWSGMCPYPSSGWLRLISQPGHERLGIFVAERHGTGGGAERVRAT